MKSHQLWHHIILCTNYNFCLPCQCYIHSTNTLVITLQSPIKPNWKVLKVKNKSHSSTLSKHLTVHFVIITAWHPIRTNHVTQIKSDMFNQPWQISRRYQQKSQISIAIDQQGSIDSDKALMQQLVVFFRSLKSPLIINPITWVTGQLMHCLIGQQPHFPLNQKSISGVKELIKKTNST